MNGIWRVLIFILPFSLSAFQPSESDQETIRKVPAKKTDWITLNQGPHIQGGINTFLTGDFIYWTARMDGLSFAASGLGNQQTNVAPGHLYDPNWKWDSGFKVGLGHNLPHDQWDIYLEYTWIESRADRTITGNTIDPKWNVSDLESFISRSLLPNAIESAKGNWSLRFNVIDLELRRNFYVSPYLSLRPYIGMKTTWQDINYQVTYQTRFTDQISKSRLHMENDADFWGIGMRTGTDTTWHIDSVFSIYGSFAISALWSQYETVREDKRLDSNSPYPNPTPELNTEINTYHTQKDFHTLKGILEFEIGIRAEWWMRDSRYHYLIQAGWEEQLWVNHNPFIKTHFVESTSGDMILQGFVLKMRFDF